MKLVAAPCDCQYDGSGGSTLAPVIPCAEHRYITCGGCGGRAEVSPIGVLCLQCTFGHEPTEKEE